MEEPPLRQVFDELEAVLLEVMLQFGQRGAVFPAGFSLPSGAPPPLPAATLAALK
jgi:hypothetical protein